MNRFPSSTPTTSPRGKKLTTDRRFIHPVLDGLGDEQDWEAGRLEVGGARGNDAQQQCDSASLVRVGSPELLPATGLPERCQPGRDFPRS